MADVANPKCFENQKSSYKSGNVEDQYCDLGSFYQKVEHHAKLSLNYNRQEFHKKLIGLLLKVIVWNVQSTVEKLFKSGN